MHTPLVWVKLVRNWAVAFVLYGVSLHIFINPHQVVIITLYSVKEEEVNQTSQRDPNACSRFLSSGSFSFSLFITMFSTMEAGCYWFAITHTCFYPTEEDIGYFQIDAVTGELRTTRPLSHAERSDYRMTVTAKDQGMPSLEGHATVYIQVLICIVLIEQLC